LILRTSERRKILLKILKKAIKLEKITKRITPKAIEFIAKLSNGDARIALSDLELALY